MANFSMKWADFENNIRDSFKDLRAVGDNSDVTLVTEDDHIIHAHKIILAAGSDFFNKIFSKTKHKNLLIYLKGIKKALLDKVLDFVYNGEANVAQEDLDNFLDTSIALHVKGLQSKIDFAMIPHNEKKLSDDESNVKTILDLETNSVSLDEEMAYANEEKNDLELNDFADSSSNEDDHDESIAPVLTETDGLKGRGSALDWIEVKKFPTIEEFKVSDIYNEIETTFTRRRRREYNYASVSEYQCKFSRKLGFLPCPCKYKVSFPSHSTEVVVEAVHGTPEHNHSQDPDYLWDGVHQFRWSDQMSQVVMKGISEHKRPGRIMKDLLCADIDRRNLPSKSQLYNKIAATKSLLVAKNKN